MKHRTWDEVCGEFNNVSHNQEGDDSEPERTETLNDLQIVLGYFNGGHHIYLEVKGPDDSVDAFEEAFTMAIQIYEPKWNVDGFAAMLHHCTADNLDYLKKRFSEYEAEENQNQEEATKRIAARAQRWQNSRWHNLDLLVQAARNAGWEEEFRDNCYNFTHIAAQNADGDKLQLELTIDDSRRIRKDLWVSDSTSLLYANGCASSFCGWNATKEEPYVWDLDLIERWAGIPTPQQAIAALKQIATWDEHYARSLSAFPGL